MLTAQIGLNFKHTNMTDIIVKSIDPVLINAEIGRTEIAYFRVKSETRENDTIYNGEKGCMTYVIEVCEMISGKLIPVVKVSPITGTYKLSTWFSLFGELSANELEAQKAALMIQQIDYNSHRYFDLTADKLEIYVP